MGSHASLRAVGSMLHIITNGASSKYSTYSFALSKHGFVNGNLFSSISSSTSRVSLYEVKYGSFQVRTIRTFPHVCMGRRSCKIVGKKKGGPNTASNTLLAGLLEKFKELDVPKEILERNIKRATEKGQEAYVEKIYEVYGYGGVSMVVEVLTNKITRSVTALREVVRDYGGKTADPGSVAFKFRRAWVVNIKAIDVNKDQLFDIALDAGAEDVIEPAV
ncbi:hypothetical protein EZV62_005169 [Acer yangbiense]|uniref:TACO1/YebC-like second and third domain-containing protein n=1 Tax=Acer yangbiense TaxID=1000413 RepID=A0A5C7IN18_9ROSI|nr:hypothetical protein EZV62_005169 [Acer yangbiense]